MKSQNNQPHLINHALEIFSNGHKLIPPLPVVALISREIVVGNSMLEMALLSFSCILHKFGWLIVQIKLHWLRGFQ